MEATITVEELRKVAKSLGIKNVKNYKKVELLKLVEEEQKKIEDQNKSSKGEKKERKKRDISFYPRGKASKEIYEEILKHRGYKKWTLYRLFKEGKYSYTNIRRVYKKYIEPYLETEGILPPLDVEVK